MKRPELRFRNPSLLERAWELQRRDRDRFVRFFGSDMVLIPGMELAARMREYLAFSRCEVVAQLAGQESDSAWPVTPLSQSTSRLIWWSPKRWP
jgi:hypothetical protein